MGSRERESASPSAPALPRPSTVSEWLLYTVLHRANLLQYYDTFIAQGGDDVQQLLEASGEEEFLEIMALVGMASKPLHVRRLQKTLQEFSLNPARFQLLSLQHQTAAGGMTPSGSAAAAIFPTSSSSTNPFAQSPTASLQSAYNQSPFHPRRGTPHTESPGPLEGRPLNGGPGTIWGNLGFTANVLPGGEIGFPHHCSPVEYCDFGDTSFNAVTPTLTDEQVQRLVEKSADLVKTHPDYEPKLVQNKKKVSKDLMAVMDLDVSNPSRLDEFRRYAAIYGRFDAKRKADKALTLHEVSVNEAAAQICLLRPALLTRRDELFPLARQVVRDSGYNYAKGSAKTRAPETDEGCDIPRKRSATAESIGSSGDRSHTPSSSTAGTPPAVSQTDPIMAGSPSSSGTSGGGTTILPRPSPRFVSEYASLNESERRAKLEDLTTQLQCVVAEQELCKRRVEAADLAELTEIQGQLATLVQRQIDLSDRQAALLTLLGTKADSGWTKEVKQEPEEDQSQRVTRQSSRRELSALSDDISCRWRKDQEETS